MNISIEHGARVIKISDFRMWLMKTSSDGACLALNESGTNFVWIFRGRWFTRKSIEETLEVCSRNGSCEFKLLKVENERVLLRIATRKHGREKVEMFWLLMKPEA